MTRKSNAMYDLIHIDPVYIVVSISINIGIPLNIRRSLLNQIMHDGKHLSIERAVTKT